MKIILNDESYLDTLRDRFAAAALIGLLANERIEIRDKTRSDGETLAIQCWAMADAMMEKRGAKD